MMSRSAIFASLLAYVCVSFAYDLRLISIDTSALINCNEFPCIAPNASASVSVVVLNTGVETWNLTEVVLKYQTNSCMTTSDCLPNIQNFILQGSKNIAQGENASFVGVIVANTLIGGHNVDLRASVGDSMYFGSSITVNIEISCSDGNFCNGIERWDAVEERCLNANNPCEDNNECTIDICDSIIGKCDFTINATLGCTTCFENKNCTRDCAGKICGEDGCGGVCGECVIGEACSSGICAVSTAEGTCTNPILIWTPASNYSLIGTHVFTGNNSLGVHEVVPACNEHTRATELIYSFEVPQGYSVGIDARSHGPDTVLDLRGSNCFATNSSIECSDDSTPPGDFGSRVAALLGPGTYYLIVDAYNAGSVGEFVLTVKFVNDCVPLCGGRFCGDDFCGGFCGECTVNESCDAVSYRCAPLVCIPDCAGAQCGEDGCGGSCGDCQGSTLCVRDTRTCDSFPYCNHLRPVCQNCTAGQYCGSDCQCYGVNDPLPDLIIDREALVNRIKFEDSFFTPENCAVVEGCLGDVGWRRLMRFDVLVINQGFLTLEPPGNPGSRPDLFIWSNCHGHYHFYGFASYELLDVDGNIVVMGRKQAYCMLDSSQALFAPHVPCQSTHDCDHQGVMPGWGDLYSNDLDCQWIDVTDLAAGDYYLRVYTNFERTFHEVSFENNIETVPVSVPPMSTTTGSTTAVSTGVVSTTGVSGAVSTTGELFSTVQATTAATTSNNEASDTFILTPSLFILITSFMFFWV